MNCVLKRIFLPAACAAIGALTTTGTALAIDSQGAYSCIEQCEARFDQGLQDCRQKDYSQGQCKEGLHDCLIDHGYAYEVSCYGNPDFSKSSRDASPRGRGGSGGASRTCYKYADPAPPKDHACFEQYRECAKQEARDCPYDRLDDLYDCLEDCSYDYGFSDYYGNQTSGGY